MIYHFHVVQQLKSEFHTVKFTLGTVLTFCNDCFTGIYYRFNCAHFLIYIRTPSVYGNDVIRKIRIDIQQLISSWMRLKSDYFVKMLRKI